VHPKKLTGHVVKLYESLKIFGGEMNEFYKFEGVEKPTFY